jgi:hypothetical protein
MIARFEIGEVLLATSIGLVLRQLRVAVVPCHPSLLHQLAEEHSIHLREFGGLAERKRSLRIKRDGEFGPEPLGNLPLGNAEALEHRVRDIQGHPHAPHNTAVRRLTATPWSSQACQTPVGHHEYQSGSGRLMRTPGPKQSWRLSVDSGIRLSTESVSSALLYSIRGILR